VAGEAHAGPTDQQMDHGHPGFPPTTGNNVKITPTTGKT